MNQHTQLALSHPAILVIFGITGDLAQRKLLPALYFLSKNHGLPQPMRIVGVTRRGMTVQDVITGIRQAVEKTGETCDQAVLDHIGAQVQIVTMDLLDPAAYVQLGQQLSAIEDQAGACMTRLLYLAIPAQTFQPVVRRLGEAGLHKGCRHQTGATRLLIEKPFGYDLASAKQLVAELNHDFSEEQIYRIDHYLAKETAQNILHFRFQNPIFKRVWDNQCIRRITVTAAETIGIEGRVAFYDQTGALRDVVQSHLLQLLALVTMDEPKEFTANQIHRQKQVLLQRIAPITADKVATDAVRGQYSGYLEEIGKHESFTETYAALRLSIQNDRWRGVPIVLRAGKALAKKTVEVVVEFADSSPATPDNVLTLHIQPHEGINVRLLAKKPGFARKIEPVDMSFDYHRSFAAQFRPNAYERVLLDAMRGDKTLFATSEQVLASWRIVENVLHEWGKNGSGLHLYKPGTDGPTDTDTLLGL